MTTQENFRKNSFTKN